MSFAVHRLIVAVLLFGLGTLVPGTCVQNAHGLYDYDGHAQTTAATATAVSDGPTQAIVPELAHDKDESHGYDDRAQSASALARPRGQGLAPNTALKLPTSQTWGRLDTLDDHVLRHGADFGARSADDYASQASQFFQRSQRQGLPTRIDANGVIRVYDPATNTFGAYNPNGTTATFFTPKTGADYWAKQPGVSPWSP